nr:MAG TPA: hypothetical protein [Caudoviricetes sp.]
MIAECSPFLRCRPARFSQRALRCTCIATSFVMSDCPPSTETTRSRTSLSSSLGSSHWLGRQRP